MQNTLQILLMKGTVILNLFFLSRYISLLPKNSTLEQVISNTTGIFFYSHVDLTERLTKKTKEFCLEWVNAYPYLKLV